MTYTGHIQSGTVILDSPPAMADGTKVEVELRELSKPLTDLDYYRDFIGSIKDLPADFALNHKHYTHGAEKR